MSRSRVSFITLGESISLADSASETREKNVPLTELVSFTDDTNVGKTVTQFISESISLRDSKYTISAMLPLGTLSHSWGSMETFTVDGSTYAIITSLAGTVDIIDLNDPENLVVVDSEQDESNGFTMISRARGVDTFTIGSSTYAIVTSSSEPFQTDGGVQIIDVSDPTNIVALDTLAESNSLALADANSVDTFTIGSSTYAIVTAVGYDDGVQMIDISDPTDIVALDTLYDSDPDTILDGPTGVETFTIGSSTYAIVTSTHGTTGIQTIDISDPTNIVALDSETDDVNGFDFLQYPQDVEIFTVGASTYAIVSVQGDGSGAVILDVTDPTNIVEKDGVQRNVEFPVFYLPYSIDTFTIDSSTYAIVSARNDDGVQRIDISDPTNMVGAGTAVDDVNGFTELEGAMHVKTFTMGFTTYAIVSSLEDGGIQIIQLSTESTDERFVKITKLVELGEFVSLTDTTDEGKAYTKSLSESISLADSASETSVKDVSLTESVSFTDDTGVGKTVTQFISESISLRDSNPSAPTDIVALDAETDELNLFYDIGGAGDIATFVIDGKMYAITAAWRDNAVTVIDVSDPANIVAVSSVIDDATLELEGAAGVDVFTIGSSTYAIIASIQDNGVQILDVSDPTNIVANGSYEDSYMSDVLNGATDVETFTVDASTYAIVASKWDNGVQILDISDPENIYTSDSATDEFNGFTALQEARDVGIFTTDGKTYAIISSSDGVQVIDVSTPYNIVAVDSLIDSGSLVLEGGTGVDIFTVGSNTYAINAAYQDWAVTVIDVSDPTNIVAVSSVIDDMTLELEGVSDVDVFTVGSNTYAIATSWLDNGVQILDISDPTNIVALDAATDGVNGFTELEQADYVETFTIGFSTYAIVRTHADDGIQMIQLSTDEEFVKITKLVELGESVIH